MPTFEYIARSRSGEKQQGSLEATDRKKAMLQIQRMGYVPSVVKESGADVPASDKKSKDNTAAEGDSKGFKFEWSSSGRKKMKLGEVLVFTRELSDLLASGMTLGTALGTLAKRKTNSAQGFITEVLKEDIVQGKSLSDALAKHPDTFPSFYVSMVHAGEASGQLSESLNNLVSHYERLAEAKEKISMALVYPVIVLGIGFLTIVFVMMFVVPRFAIIFQDLGSTLPLPTRMLIVCSNLMLKYGVVFLGLAILGVIALRRYIKTDAGRRQWDGFLLRIPVIRDVISANAFSNFARTLGSLLRNGVPVLNALKIVEHTVGNQVIADEIAGAREKVTDGATISSPLAQGKVFPPLLTDMLKVGEETGDVPSSLGHIARRYDEDLNRSIKVFTTVLEPVLMLLMAVVVGFVALSMLLAVFEMTNGLDL